MGAIVAWCGLLFGIVLLLYEDKTVDAWHRQAFTRNPRNLFSRNDAVIGGGGDGDDAGVGGGGDGGSGRVGRGIGKGLRASARELNAYDTGHGMENGGNGFDELNALFAIRDGIRQATQAEPVALQIEPEVYGIVEPLIEETPCANRACDSNSDCCPTGVCVNTYGEGKCVYAYGRKRDLCRRNIDCEPGGVCLKDVSGIWMCMDGNVALRQAYELKQFSDECVSSADCHIAKGMCCQLQRSHQRVSPKKLCAYFRDPFACIDIIQPEKDDMRDRGRLLTLTFQKQRI